MIRKNIKAELLKKNIQKKTIINKMKTDIEAIDNEITQSKSDLKEKTTTYNNLTKSIAVTDSNIDAKTTEFEFLTTNLKTESIRVTDLKKERAALEIEFNRIMDSVSPSLLTTVSKLNDAVNSTISARDTYIVNSSPELNAVLDTNPGTIAVITHKNGTLKVIDNRASKRIDARVTTIPTSAVKPVNSKTEHPHGRIDTAHGTDPTGTIPQTKHELEIDFKLQVQENEGKKYHLLLKMPTQFIDFVFDNLPTKSFEATKEVAKTIRWTTVGDISLKHQLNGGCTRNRITIVDSGKALLVLDGDNQKIVVTLLGDKYKCVMTATRQQKTDVWDMGMV